MRRRQGHVVAVIAVRPGLKRRWRWHARSQCCIAVVVMVELFGLLPQLCELLSFSVGVLSLTIAVHVVVHVVVHSASTSLHEHSLSYSTEFFRNDITIEDLQISKNERGVLAVGARHCLKSCRRRSEGPLIRCGQQHDAVRSHGHEDLGELAGSAAVEREVQIGPYTKNNTL